MRVGAFLLAALSGLVAGPALAMADCGAPATLSDGWAVSAPEQQGLDPVSVCAIGPRFDAWKEADAHAIVVARHGALVYEHYLTGDDQKWGQPIGRVAYGASTRHDIRSITKSVTALVVGIAFDRGWLKDLDQPVFSFFPEHADLRTPEKDKITIRHLLTMSAGFVWDESLPYSDPRNSERPMDDAADPVRYVLEQPLEASPGAYYNYCGCSAVLLSKILQKVSGKPLDALAKEALFEPLGITDIEWGRFDNGDVTAHAGLRLRPRDLLKIGQLVLNHGQWQGRQIVSPDWIAQSTAPQINGEGVLFYGYQWWLGRSLVNRREIDWASGVGYGGQRLYIVPSEDLVVAFLAGLYNSRLQSWAGLSVLNRNVLPAAVR